MQIFIFLSVLLLLIVLFAVVKIHQEGTDVSISQHAAKKGWTYVIFGLSLTIIGSLFLIFLQASLFPSIGMPYIFYLLLPLSWICLIITAWIPDKREGKLSVVHTYAALGIAISMAIIIFGLLFATHISLLFQLIAGITTLWYIYTLYLYFFVKKSHQYYLVYQTVNMLSFFIIILAISILH
jgi:hypothetical protein